MMNVLLITTIAESFIDVYVSVTIQLPSSVQYENIDHAMHCIEDGKWMVTETYASIKGLAIVVIERTFIMIPSSHTGIFYVMTCFNKYERTFLYNIHV